MEDRRANQLALTTSLTAPGPSARVIVQSRFQIFPFSLPCCSCLPSGLAKIQDWLHLVLVAGILGSVLCVVQLIYELEWGGACGSFFCARQIISGLFLLPSTVYFIRTIGSYDEQLRCKKERHTKEVENLIQHINTAVNDLNEVCHKMAMNANDFAMTIFDDKTKNLTLFLRNVKWKKDLYVNEALLSELKEYVIQWMTIFSGGMLRAQSGVKGNFEAKIRGCQRVEDVVEVALSAIKENEMRIKYEKPAEIPLLSERRDRDVEEGQPGCLGASNAQCGVTWIKFERRASCGCRRSPTEDSMPLMLSFGPVRLRVLSSPHLNLMMAFLLDVVLIFSEVVWGRYASLSLVLVNMVSVVALLLCYEQINEIAQLEKEIHRFARRSEEVEIKRDEARIEWDKTERLQELWKRRTFPCLRLMGKITEYLEDKDFTRHDMESDGSDRDQIQAYDEGRVAFLRFANQSMRGLEANLGATELWLARQDPNFHSWKMMVGDILEKVANQEFSRVPSVLATVKDEIGELPDPEDDIPQLAHYSAPPRAALMNVSPASSSFEPPPQSSFRSTASSGTSSFRESIASLVGSRPPAGSRDSSVSSSRRGN